jgi:hypothetical protein
MTATRKAFALLGLFSVLAAASLAAGKSTTFEGALVDSKCYLMDHKNNGNDHGTIKQCGTLCLKAGTPGGLLTKDNKFYTILAPSIALAPYVGETIRITGSLVSGAIDADKIEVMKDGKWEPVKMGEMM